MLEVRNMKRQIFLAVLVASLFLGETTFATAAPAKEETVRLEITGMT